MLIWSWSSSRGETQGSALGEPAREKAMQHRARGVGYRAHPDAGQLAGIGRLIGQGKAVRSCSSQPSSREHRTRRWRKTDPNSRSRLERNSSGGCSGQPSASRSDLKGFGYPCIRIGRPTNFRKRWDREFESTSLQQAVCLSGERRGCTGKAPHFGGILQEPGDVRRDAQAANRASFALSL
jgi:hypothetical protein